jgi:hypothetical protein
MIGAFMYSSTIIYLGSWCRWVFSYVPNSGILLGYNLNKLVRDNVLRTKSFNAFKNVQNRQITYLGAIVLWVAGSSLLLPSDESVRVRSVLRRVRMGSEVSTCGHWLWYDIKVQLRVRSQVRSVAFREFEPNLRRSFCLCDTFLPWSHPSGRTFSRPVPFRK